MERGSPLLRRRRGFCAVNLLLFKVIFLASSIKAQDSLSLSNASSGEMHREGYCSMYGICAQRSDGKVLNCANGSFSTKPSSLLSSKIQTLCPTMTGNVCCNAAQFETLREQVQQAVPLLVGCPACLRNFLNLFCELSCSPNQSLFINVTSAKKVNNTLTVNDIDFFLTNTYGEELYNSCKDVKFGSINTRVMDFIGAGAQNYKDFLAFLGRQAALNAPGSPYNINFQSTTPLSSQMKPINSTVYSCGDSLLGCSCGDCFSSSACSVAAPSSLREKGSCKIAIGLVKVKCIELSLAILYLVVISGFLLWVFLRKGERGPLSESKHLLNDNGENDLHTGYKQTNTIPHMHMSEGLSLVKFLRPSIVQDSMARVFRKYGAFVSRKPTFVLFLSLAVPVLLILGLINFRVETKPEKLWVGHGSRAAAEKHFFDHNLAPFYRIEQLVLATVPLKNAKAPSIVTDQNMKLLFELQKKVDELHVTYSGSMVSLADICLKPLANDCATQSVLQYFKMDQERYDNYGGVQHAEYCFEHFYSEESCRSAFQAPLDPGTVLGGFPESNYSEASALITTYPVNNEVGNNGDENGKAVAWERAFIRLVKEELMPMVQLQNLTLSFSSESSIQDELERESSSDVVTILVSYVVMFAYISFMLGDTPTLHSCFVTSKVLLGLSGVIVVMLSVLGSIGFYSAMGVKSTLIIMEVIPFLVLAVGVDNMCILLHAVKRQATEMSLESKISNALMEVGPSITLASLSEVLAFAAGSFIPMPAVRVFSMFAAFAVFLDFILQVTAFVALIIFDFSRTDDNRIDCFPCIKLSSSSGSERVASVVQRKPGFLVRYMEDFHAPMLAVPGVKYAVIALFTAATFLSIALCTRIQPGLEQKIVLPRNSYLQGYFDDLARYLRVGPPLYFVVKDFNYSLESNQTNKICSISQCDSNSLLNEITRASLIPETSFIAKPAASWLDDFLGWLSPKAFSCCRKFTNGSYCPPDDQAPCCQPNGVSCDISGICKDCTTCFHQSDMHEGRPSTAQFKEKLPWFLKASPSANCAKGGNGAYTSSIDLTGFNTGIIRASSFRTYHKPLSRQIDYVNAMKAARDFSSRVSDSLKLQVFPYSVYYIFFEQYINIWKTALINIAIGLGAVFIICLIITCSLWTSAIILLVLAMIILDIMGVMAILNIQLNAISVVNLVMSIGIAVEFCVHITHAFVVSSGNRGSRMKEALSTMGASVFSGITMTKLVGVIVLCFAKSQVFVVYYFQMYLALVLIGSLHGLVFLPVLLSICGPPSRWIVKEVPQEQPAVEAQAN